jgi:single-stranded DNA-binding protein
MGINCSFYGFLVADAERRSSAAGRTWVRLRVAVGRAEAAQRARVVALGETVDAASTLKRGDRIYVEGRLTLDKWRHSNGAEKYGLSIVASKIEKVLRPPA